MSSAVLLLHGQPGGAPDWAGVVAALAPSGAPVVAPDRPGWDQVGRPMGVAGNAEAALAALESRGHARAVVVGHSFGGAVAAWLAAYHPDRVAGLVLAAPSANVASLYAFDHLIAVPVAGELAGAVLMSLAGLGLGLTPARRRLARLFAVDESYLFSVGQRLLRPGAWRAFAVEQRALVRELPMLEPALSRIAVPTRILAGTEDRIVPLASLRQLAAQIGGAELVELEGAGHMLPLRRPTAVAEAVLTVAGKVV